MQQTHNFASSAADCAERNPVICSDEKGDKTGNACVFVALKQRQRTWLFA